MKYTPLGKANVFRHSLENSFQENLEPYCNIHIIKVNRIIKNYFTNANYTKSFRSYHPMRVIQLIKKINPKKATRPDGVLTNP
ncbi:hypothetical protein AVEN_97105-1 [Araneus ventricosus]|uniref:Uncharacterized protein n=1 Tax=Araneus ventricosus TaxID=182803 RepID=A0A4Y2VMT7_ARAVE|nr:hypothetical protein AVEN_97105-1 [Araneus ventricosus]